MADAKRTPSRTAIEELPAEGGAIHDVFLSPRVVDREAFNDFSGSLKRLIEQATGQGEELKAATEQATAAHQQLRDLATRHTARFEAAARAVTALDDRASRAEQMLAAAQKAAGALDTLKADADRIVADRIAAMESRLEARLAESAGRIAQLEDRLGTFAELVETKLAEARQAISGFEARAVQNVEDAATASRRTFDGVCELLSRHAEDLRLTLVSSADVQRERIDQQTDSALTRTREASKAAASAADLAESRVASLAADAQRQTQEQRRHLTDLLLKAEEAAGEAETLLGLTGGLPDEDDGAACEEASVLALPGSLADLILKARRHRAAAQRAVQELDAAKARAEESGSALGQSLTESAGRIAALESRAGSLGEMVTQSLAACDHAARTLSDRKEEIERLISRPLTDLQARAEEARVQIVSMDTHTRRAREATQVAIERTGEIVRGLAGLLEQLRPWQPLLLDADPNAEIPPALRGLIDQVRADIAGDLATIATGLQHVALRAQRTGAAVT